MLCTWHLKTRRREAAAPPARLRVPPAPRPSWRPQQTLQCPLRRLSLAPTVWDPLLLRVWLCFEVLSSRWEFWEAE